MIKVYLNCPMVGRTREQVAETFAQFRLVTLAYLYRERDEVVFVNDAPTYELSAETYTKYVGEQAPLAMTADIIVTVKNDYRDPIACMLNTIHGQGWKLLKSNNEPRDCFSSYFRVPEECVWSREENEKYYEQKSLPQHEEILEDCNCLPH